MGSVRVGTGPLRIAYKSTNKLFFRTLGSRIWNEYSVSCVHVSKVEVSIKMTQSRIAIAFGEMYTLCGKNYT